VSATIMRAHDRCSCRNTLAVIGGRLHTRVLAACILATCLALVACQEPQTPLQEAQALTGGVLHEATSTAGVHYDVTATLNGISEVPADTPREHPQLAAYEASYTVTIRSLEVTAFEQRVSTTLPFGPGAEPLIGGLHDWSLFRNLDKWDASRRHAFLRYIATTGNPHVQSASRLDIGWHGEDLEPGAPLGRRLRELGTTQGFGQSDLAWIVIENPHDGDPAPLWREELIGFDEASRTWRLLAHRAVYPDGPLLEEPLRDTAN